MMPQAFTKLIDSCNQTILALESSIAAADTCEDVCKKITSCPSGAYEFITQAQHCIPMCQATIKICEEVAIQLKQEELEESIDAMHKAVKALGECIRSLQESIEKCSLLDGCRGACQDARNSCEKALIAVDICIEKAQKHTRQY